METTLMNVKTLNTRQAARGGMCEGKLNDSEDFNAGLVELSLKTFDPPHGEAYEMLARHRLPQDSATKEIFLSFSKGAADGSYDLTPDQNTVRLTFVHNISETESLIYSQVSGKAELKLDPNTGVFSGELKDAVVQYREEETPVSLNINVRFEAINKLVKYTTSHKSYRAA
jgi:hypothetical protein